MGVYFWVRESNPPVTDVLTTGGSASSGTGLITGVTAKVHLTLDKIGFLATTTGTVYIAQGTSLYEYDGNTLVEYSVSSANEFTLPTPYEMAANTSYVIWVSGSSATKYQNRLFPKDGTNVTFFDAGTSGWARATSYVTTTEIDE